MLPNKIRTLLVCVLVLVGCASPSSIDVEAEDLSKDDANAMLDENADAFLGGVLCREKWINDNACDARLCGERDVGDCSLFSSEFHPTRIPLPVVLHHGFNASASQWSYVGVRDDLRKVGVAAYEVEAPPYSEIATRVPYLQRVIDTALAETGAKKVHLIAHSMGGLDARFLIAHGYASKIASLTTIATPHHGTRVADVALGIGSHSPSAVRTALDAVAGLFGRTFSSATDKVELEKTLRDLSVAQSLEFNAMYPRHPGVFYQSWAGVATATGHATLQADAAADSACGDNFYRLAGRNHAFRHELLLASAVVAAEDGRTPQDGLVSVESAKYGEFRGCVPADHRDILGDPRAALPFNESGFNHLGFYRRIVHDLALKGLR